MTSVGLSACHAPRDNPFDPASPIYLSPEPPSRVTDLSADSISAFQCRFTWSAPEGAIAYRFEIGPDGWDGIASAGVRPYNGELPGIKTAGTLVAVWVNLIPDEIQVWALSSQSSAGLWSQRSNLVRIQPPRRDRIATLILDAHTNHIAWWGLPDQYSLDIRAELADSDGVDSVWIGRELTYLAALTSQGDGRTWLKEIKEYELPDGTVDELIGYPIDFYHRDRAGFVTRDTTIRLVRVIRDVPQTEAPYGDTLISRQDDLILRWHAFDARYFYTYSLDIIHMSDAFVPTRVYSDSLISSDSTMHRVTTALTRQPGFFLWTVTVVDAFGNRARSREASFWLRDD